MLKAKRIFLFALPLLVMLLMGQGTGPTVFTPRLTVSPGPLTVSTGDTTVEDLIINGTCTGCGGVTIPSDNGAVVFSNGSGGAKITGPGFTNGNLDVGTSIAPASLDVFGPIAADSDTAATYVFIDDNDTGMGNPSANVLNFFTDAVERGRYTTSGLAVTGTLSATGSITQNGIGVCLATGGPCTTPSSGTNDDDISTYTGFSADPADCNVANNWIKANSSDTTAQKVGISFTGTCTGTSNAATFTLDLPADLDCPVFNAMVFPIIVVNNGVTQMGRVSISTFAGVGSACTATFGATVAASGGFTGSGTKGILANSTISW